MNTIDSEVEGNFLRKTHPDFPNQQITHDPTGDRWIDAGLKANYIYGPYFLDSFKLNDIVSNKNKTIDEMLNPLKPLQEENKRFFDSSVFEGVSDMRLSIDTRNVNADLGTQARIRLMIKEGVIDEHTFVILSHGHFIAGLAELTKAVTKDGKYMFDTTVYFPIGEWLPDSNSAKGVAQQQLQLWSESIKKSKEEHMQQKRKPGGGIAVGLFGHRSRFDLRNKAAMAKINPEDVFGEVDEYASFLKNHDLNKVVIVTEETDASPTRISNLPMERLKEGVFGNENEDLYVYFRALASKGVNVEVVSGDVRPGVGYLGKKLVEEDKKRNK